MLRTHVCRCLGFSHVYDNITSRVYDYIASNQDVPPMAKMQHRNVSSCKSVVKFHITNKSDVKLYYREIILHFPIASVDWG